MRAGRPTDMSRELEVVMWPPLRPARLRCERGSVIVVSPAGSLDLDQEIIGMDIHRVAAEVVALCDGELTRLGRFRCFGIASRGSQGKN